MLWRQIIVTFIVEFLKKISFWEAERYFSFEKKFLFKFLIAFLLSGNKFFYSGKKKISK